MNKIKELYQYRQMLVSLVQKDLRGRNKASVLGFLWTFINPLLQLVIYTIVFSLIMRSGIEDFYMFLFVALVPWIFFSSSLVGGSMAIVTGQDLVKKIYFPRIVLPISYVISCFVNMLFSFLVIFAVIFITGFGVNLYALLFLPIVMVIELLLALGISLMTSALTVYFRDLEHILGLVSMMWMYLSPVVYPMEWVPERLLFLFHLNPMSPIIAAYRQILYYKKFPDLSTMASAVVLGLVFVVLGSYIFDKLQKGFVEEM